MVRIFVSGVYVPSIRSDYIYPNSNIDVSGSGGRHNITRNEEIMGVRSVVSTVWRGKYYIILCFIIFLALALAIVGGVGPKYKARSALMFENQKVNVTSFEELLTAPESSLSQLENEVQVLNSVSLLSLVAERLGLQDDPQFNTAFAQDGDGSEGQDSLPETAAGAGFPGFSWLRDLLADGPEQSPTPQDLERRKLLGAVKQLQSNLTIQPVDKSSVIEISYDSYSPELSANIVNAIVSQYMVSRLEFKLQTAGSATAWLTARVDELRRQVQASEEAVETLREQLASNSGQGLDITQQQLASLNSSLSAARGQAANAEARFQQLSEAVAAGRELSAETPALSEYRDQESALLLRRKGLSSNHPALAQIDAELETVRARTRITAQGVLVAAEVELQTSRTQVAELEQGVRSLESKALAQSRDEIRLRQMEREADANRLLYENLLSRLNETSKQDELQTADVRILSSAEPPIEPVARKKPQIVVIAGVLGALLGAGFVLVRDNLSNTFRSPRQIEEMTAQPVLATLPMLGSRMKREDLIAYLLQKPGSSLAEAARDLRTSILTSNAATPPKVVMLTSSFPGEGKSTISLLTALASRQMGKSTIIVDCDLRASSISRFFSGREGKEGSGILSALSGTATLQEALHEDKATGLHALTVSQGAAQADRNAADILSSRDFADLVQRLSQIYDLVILDTPPTLIVTDARIVSALADVVVYIVRWDETPRDAVLEGLKELQSIRAPIAGTVLSMIDEKRAANTIFDGYTHHRGRHRDYYAS